MAADNWIVAESSMTDERTLRRLRHIVEEESPLIVEHRSYRGSRSPHRFVCDVYDDLEEYLLHRAAPGDSFYVWRFEDCCVEGNVVERGKVPDEHGRVPEGGAY